jgi:predicted RNase H-like HicB family nuclease
MKNYTAVVEHCPETDLYVGYVPGFPGAHSQGATRDELQCNLQEVVAMLLEDGEPQLEAEFVGTQNLVVAWAWETFQSSSPEKSSRSSNPSTFNSFGNVGLTGNTVMSMVVAPQYRSIKVVTSLRRCCARSPRISTWV